MRRRRCRRVREVIEVDEQLADLMAGEHYQEPFASIDPNRLVKSWPKVDEALYGCAEAVRDQPFDNT